MKTSSLVMILICCLLTACSEPIAIESSAICDPGLKGKYIRVTGQLSYGGTYRCTGGMPSRCSGGFYGLDGNNHMYVEILEGTGPNRVDVRNKSRENATVFDNNGLLVRQGEPVEITGVMRVGEHNSSYICTCDVSKIHKK